MKISLSHFVFAIMLYKLAETKPLQKSSTLQQQSKQTSSLQNDYDYTGNGRSGRPQQSRVTQKEIYSQIKSPHDVLDNKNIYDYTYGDPEVDYNYDVLSSDEDVFEPNSEEGKEEEVTPSDEEDISKESSEGDHKEGTRIVTSIIEWMIRNWQRSKNLRDQWKETKNRLKKSWNQAKESMKRIKQVLEEVLTKFGKEVKEGLKYSYIKINLQDQTLEIHGFEAIQKLERLLEEGNQIVVALFKFIGQKVEELGKQYKGDNANVSSGEGRRSDNIVNYESYFPKGASDDERHQINTIESINLFEDQEVLRKLNLLVEENILSLDELEAIRRAAAEQTKRSKGSKILYL